MQDRSIPFALPDGYRAELLGFEIEEKEDADQRHICSCRSPRWLAPNQPRNETLHERPAHLQPRSVH